MTAKQALTDVTGYAILVLNAKDANAQLKMIFAGRKKYGTRWQYVMDTIRKHENQLKVTHINWLLPRGT